MNKIPVRQTVIFAYLFLYAHIGTVLAIAGLPSLLYVAADYAMHIYLVTHRMEIDSGNGPEAVLYLLVYFLTFFVKLYAYAVAAAGIGMEALGIKGVGIGHPLDRTVLRMFAADIRFLAGVLALAVLAGAVAFAGFTLAGIPFGAPATSPAAVLAWLIGVFVAVYTFVTALRIGFLLPATVAAEEKGGLVRSHDLTRGNLWRLLAIVIALGLPIVAMMIAAEAAVLGPTVMPDILQREDVIAVLQQVDDAIDQRLLPWEIYNAVVFVLYSGLFYSGAVFAYRALVPVRGGSAGNVP